MCLLTRQIKSIITKKDMIVVKRLHVEEIYVNNNTEFQYFSSYYTNFGKRFEYIPEVLNKTELGIIRSKPFGVSAFADEDSKFYKNGPLTNRKLTVVSEGFHFLIKDLPSYNNDLLYHEKRTLVFKFLIPKGSTIFLGKTGLGVSNQIIMLKP